MRLIYIAGPFNAGHGRSIEDNCRAAEALAGDLVLGYPRSVHPVVPHSLGRVLFGHQEEAEAYEGTLELMRRCDAVLLTEAWEQSKGATAERGEAHRRGLPVFEESDLYSKAGEEPRFFAWLRSVGEDIS